AAMLVRWSDYVRDFGYQNNFAASNYGEGGYVSRMLTALALSNANDSNAPRLISEMITYRNTIVLPTLQNASTSLKGGCWAEGWGYGTLATQNLLLAGLAFEEAGQGAATAERQWASDVIRAILSEQPTQATVYDGGDGFASPLPVPGDDLFQVLAKTAN